MTQKRYWFGSTHMGARNCAALALLATLAATAPADACGGFWCSQSSPVNQTGEQIVFAANPDGTVTCVVQIAYAGPSEKFAWLLPVAGVPDIGVSANLALQRLSQATQPQFQLTYHYDGDCYAYTSAESAGGGGTGGSGAGAPDAGAVQVLDSGSVGPYDYTVISVDPTLPNPADVAIDWLTAEGYDVFGVSSAVLGPYLADGLNLVAFRLTKGNDSGSIRPVILTYPGDKPSIPIRPTAVAAQDDMGILVWVLGQHQAVPQNYRSLVLNEALINWFDPMSNYDAVVTAAANEAGGQGFVTEAAGPSATYAQTVFSSYEAQGWTELQEQAGTAQPIDLIWSANAYFRGWDGWREAVEGAVTLPAGATIDEFAQDPDAFRDTAVVDSALFLETLYANVVEPVERTQAIIDSRPYLTRLYSTMSADEMTIDPTFTFNPDLAPVSNVHTADVFFHCSPGDYDAASWRLALPQGGTLVGGGQYSWPLALDGSLPANKKIVQLSESGSGEVIVDNSVLIAAAIVELGGTNTPPTLKEPEVGMPIGGPIEPVVLPEPAEATPASEAGEESSGCGCSVPGRSQSPSALVIGALGLVAARLRRGTRLRRGDHPAH